MEAILEMTIDPWDIVPIKNDTTKRILATLQSKEKLIMLRAPAGSGKTVTALAYALTQAMNGKRIAIFFRTVSQVNYALSILHDLIKKNEKSARRVRVIPTLGKVQYCIKPPREGQPFPRWCDYSKCDLRKMRSRNRLPDSFSSINEFIKECKARNECPYYRALLEASKADIVIATQAFVVNDNLFEKLEDLNEAIIDEAHGLLFLTFEIDHDTYNRGKKLSSTSISKLTISDAISLSKYEDYIRSDGEEVIFSDKRIKILPPIRLIKKRIRKLEKLILMSATIYPTNLFKLVFAKDINARIEVVPGLVRSNEKREIIGIAAKGLTSRHKERTPQTYDRYARIIRLLIRKYGEPALILAPSYEFAKEIAERLGIKVIRDPAEWNGKVVVSVLRGRLSEGIDIDLDEPLRLLIIAGLPYRPRTKEFISIAKIYANEYGIDFYSLARALEESDMVNTLIQALGRIGRKEKGVGIILDERIKTKKIGITVRTI